jgi:hypothetical protein
MAILRDALSRNIDKAIIRKSFETYWCLAGSRGTADHAVLTEALDDATCPTETTIDNWYVVTVDGANIRSGPDIGSAKTGFALRGTLLERLEANGEWFRVRRMSDETGFIHGSLVSRFERRAP